MNKLINEYNEICKKLEILGIEFIELEDNELIKKYFSLIYEIRSLDKKRLELYEQIKIIKYKKCNHIWVNVGTFDDKKYFGCIKCGLDERVKYYDYMNYKLSYNYNIMNNLYKDNIKLKKGINTDIYCNLNIARTIYNKILENNPLIDDNTAKKYFEIAYSNMKRNNVSMEKLKREKKKNNVIGYILDKDIKDR